MIEHLKEAMRLRLRIKNAGQPRKRVEGYIWAVASFKPKEGDLTYVGAPNRLAIESDGEVADGRKSYRFSIKHYKAKTFNFPIPEGDGEFVNLKVSVSDTEGTVLLSKDVDVPDRPQREKTAEASGNQRG